MRLAIGLLAVALSTVSAVADTKAPAPPPAPKDPLALTDRAATLPPIQIDGLTLTPIVAVAAPGAPAAKEVDMLVLDEAMAAKQVKISEGERESVNDLTLINSSDRPVFVLAGEVIVGGKQDRIIGANTVIPPKTTLSVPVYCVEHGRWDSGPKAFASANALAHGRLRGKASFEQQSEVWKEVAATNEAKQTKNATDTYRTVAKQQSDGTLKAWEKRVGDALAKVPAADRARMIGYAVSLNGQVATVDMFQSPALFKKLESKLLRSYLTESTGLKPAKDVKPPTAAAVRSFMADADKAAEQRAYQNKAAATKLKKGDRANKSSVDFSDQEAAPAKAVYETYQVR